MTVQHSASWKDLFYANLILNSAVGKFFLKNNSCCKEIDAEQRDYFSNAILNFI